MHLFQEQLNNSNLIPVFEIEVFDKKTGKKDWIVCEIKVHDNKLKAYRIGLTEAEEKSNKIAFDAVDIDLDFSLDEHLNDLYSEILSSIQQSDFYEIAE